MLKIRKANGKHALDIVSIFLARSINTFLISSGLFGTAWTGLFGPFCVIPSFACTHGPTPYAVILNWLSRVSSSCWGKKKRKERKRARRFLFLNYCLQKSYLLLNSSCAITSLTSWTPQLAEISSLTESAKDIANIAQIVNKHRIFLFVYRSCNLFREGRKPSKLVVIGHTTSDLV